MGFTHLSSIERDELSIFLARDMSYREIAKELRRSPSTISREIQRNSHGNRTIYRANKAIRMANFRAGRRRKGKRKLFLNSRLLEVVKSKLKLYWSRS